MRAAEQEKAAGERLQQAVLQKSEAQRLLVRRHTPPKTLPGVRVDLVCGICFLFRGLLTHAGRQAAMLAEGAGTSVSREEAAPLVAEAERLYADALGEVSDQLGLEHPRTLALKVSSTLLASRCE